MKTIFLVDDHAMVREGLRALLEAAGYEVIGECDNPVQAVREVLRLEPDLVLLDLSLGEANGLDVLSDLRRRGSQQRCIVLTMLAQPRQVAEAMRLGANGYVLKGSPSSELLAAVAKVFAGLRHVSASVADAAISFIDKPQSDDPMGSLSMRERQIVAMVVRGKTSAAIAAELYLSPKTVDTYRSRVMAKLGVSDVTGLVRWAVRVGLVDTNPT